MNAHDLLRTKAPQPPPVTGVQGGGGRTESLFVYSCLLSTLVGFFSL